MTSELLLNYYPTQKNIKMDNIDPCFVPIYIITMTTTPLRKKYVQHAMAKNNLPFQLLEFEPFSCPRTADRRLSNSKTGCVLSHLWCIRDAVRRGLPRFAIFEDDILLHKNIHNLLPKVMDVPNIDLLMLGAMDRFIDQNNPKNDAPLYYPTHGIFGAHANIYSHEFAKYFLHHKLTSPLVEFDMEYSHFIPQWKIGVCNPPLVVTELSTSSLNHQFSPLDNYRFCCYTRWMSPDFSYENYQYILIRFLEEVRDEPMLRNATMGEMIAWFAKKHRRCMHINSIKKWLQLGGNTERDVWTIIEGN